MMEILCTFLAGFHHLSTAWDIVSAKQQFIEALTLTLLKEESINWVRGEINDEGDKTFFSSRGQSSGILSAKEKKKFAT